jgi:hypothetical protein
MDAFLEKHSGELLILILAAMVTITLLIVVPQLLRVKKQALEQRHSEHLTSLEKGRPLPPPDDRSRAAGQTAGLVPMVVIVSAATVSCFLVAFKSESLFAVALTAWCVAGIVSLAAITGGVALLGRLAQLESGHPEDEDQDANEPHRESA